MDGELIWERDVGNFANKIEVDFDGNAIIGTFGYSPNLFKYSPNGVLLWAISLKDPDGDNSFIRDLAVDSSNAIYVATFEGYVKVSPEGAILDTNYLVRMTEAVDVDPSGNIWTGHDTGDYLGAIGAILCKWTPSGELIFQYNWPGHYTNTYDIQTDELGNCYFSYDDGTTSHLVRYNAAGAVTWTVSGTTYRNLSTDYDNNIYALSNNVVQKWDSAGTLIFTSDQSANSDDAVDMDVDFAQNIYLGDMNGVYNGSIWPGAAIKLDPEGNFLWSRAFGGELECIHAGGNGTMYAGGYDGRVLKIGDPIPFNRTYNDGFILGLECGVHENVDTNIMMLHQGPKGPIGDIGPKGPLGAKGYTGYLGLRGLLGPTGLTGDKGPQGGQGIQGIVGLQGFEGIQGGQGIDGIKGVIGPQGPYGPFAFLFTNLQFYDDGFLVTYPGPTVDNYAWQKDPDGRITNLNTTAVNTTVSYVDGPTP